MSNPQTLQPTDCGKIKIYYLKLIWFYYKQLRNNAKEVPFIEWKYINAVFNTLGLGIEPTLKLLMQTDISFEQFENWIEENGTLSTSLIDHFNTVVTHKSDYLFEPEENIFSDAELEQWRNDGYIILRNAISKKDCEETSKLIYSTINASSNDPTSWYSSHPLKQGIMIQLFKAEILDKNRLSKRIKLAYQQLWKRKDLLVSMDRVSFNPPENELYKFPGPNLHWDVSLKTPIPFGLQGLLYLSDTDEDQGAFTVIPGFHNTIEKWLPTIDKNTNPRDPKLLQGFKTKPISAKAGDFIIWHHCIPHGSSPNTSKKPRIVQYINYQPIDMQYQTEWI